MGAQPTEQAPKTIGQLAFDVAFPGRAMGFTHDLHRDDRLTLASVADLADRLPRRSVIADTATQPLLVPQGGPPRGALERPGDVIRDLNNANAWLTLLNVEADPGMAELMNTYLDQLESGIIATQGNKRGKMYKRVAFVFVSSPNSITPGRAVYISPGTPHWVHNGPDISLSVTLTYFTAATIRENRIEDFNSHLRRRHMNPREPGRSATVDTAKLCAMGVWAVGQRLRSAAVGTKRGDGQAPAEGAGY